MNPDKAKTLNGEQALAYAALASGVKFVASYPGSPSSGTVMTLTDLAKEQDIYVEWSANEKVAIEMGIGASIVGRRTLICTKSVGMNLMIDPLMALNLTPVKGGLVILLGDDPGAYGSQNDQDTRPLSTMLEMPLLEPAEPSEGIEMMKAAFSLSERFETAVILRITRSFSQRKATLPLGDLEIPEIDQGFKREPWRYVPVPKNAVQKHKLLHERLLDLVKWAEQSSFNKSTGSGKKGVIAAGHAMSKLEDVIGGDDSENYRILKLGTLFPLPNKVIEKFLASCDEALILEENEPFLEMQIKALAFDSRSQTEVLGKLSGHVSREGELYRWQIQAALEGYLPDFSPVRAYLKESVAEEIPEKENFCGDAGYDVILDALDSAASRVGEDLIYVGDPGCLVTVSDRLDAKYAIGSAVALADGMSKVNPKERPVALFGDSAFFHTAIPAICNAAHNRSDILMVVLDNHSTASTGHQPHPGMEVDAMGGDAPALSIEGIARACGVSTIHSVCPDQIDTKLERIFEECLGTRELSMVIVQTRPLS